MKHKNLTGRRNFIRTSLDGMMVAGVLPGLLATITMSCRPLRAAAAVTPADDLGVLKQLLADKKNPIKWIFAGDSITQGARHTYGYRSYPEIFSEHVRFEMNRSRDLIINTAISGNATTDILNDFEWRISQFSPQVVSIMIGTNDAAIGRHISPNDFESNLRKLLQRSRDSSAIPLLHTPNPIQIQQRPAGTDRAQLPLYVAAIRRVALDMKVILVDHWAYWEANESTMTTEKWLADPLHPAGRGHLEMARLIFNTLGICTEQSFTCAGTVHF